MTDTVDAPGIDLDANAMTDEQVAYLTRPQREARVQALLTEAHALIDLGIQRHVLDDGKQLAGIALLFSGGNDSTVLGHAVKSRATHAIHANTGVGIEATRQFVRDTSAAWGLPLLERSAPRYEDSYEARVLDQGFPGFGQHNKTYQRLKERALRVARNEIVGNPRTHRVLFIAGRRRQESQQRTDIPEFERVGSIVWVSPMVNWTKLDLNTYRLMHRGDVPVNDVADLIHMSGECLCGCYAAPGEREEVGGWFPEAFEQIEQLEKRLAGPEGDHLPEHVKTWGWSNDPNVVKPKRKPRAAKGGRLCSSCDARHNAALQMETIILPGLEHLEPEDGAVAEAYAAVS